LGLVLLGCSSGSPPPSGSTSPGASAAPTLAAEAECRPIDLFSPAGDRVDLTGTWQGDVLVHHVRQVDDCVWWIAYSTWPGTDTGELGTLAFRGQVASDFTLRGAWTPIVMVNSPQVYGLPERAGPEAFRIEFDEEGRVARLVNLNPGDDANLGRYPSELMLVGPLPVPVGPPQQ
jgi:hypothetical protein